MYSEQSESILRWVIWGIVLTLGAGFGTHAALVWITDLNPGHPVVGILAGLAGAAMMIGTVAAASVDRS